MSSTSPPSGRDGFDWSRLRPAYNATTLAGALLPLALWRHVLHSCAAEQSPGAAFGLAFMALVTAVLMDRWRRSWPWRTALWTALLGVATTPTVLSGALNFMTGVHS